MTRFSVFVIALFIGVLVLGYIVPRPNRCEINTRPAASLPAEPKEGNR